MSTEVIDAAQIHWEPKKQNKQKGNERLKRYENDKKNARLIPSFK